MTKKIKMKIKLFVYAAMLSLSLSSGMAGAEGRQGVSSDSARPSIGKTLGLAQQDNPGTTMSQDWGWWLFGMEIMLNSCSNQDMLDLYGYSSLTECMENTTSIP